MSNPVVEPCVIVPRVSTGKQVEGTSLERQIEACEELAKKLGCPIHAIYREEGVSGAFYHARADLQKALVDIEEGRAKVFITYTFDRAGRDVDVVRSVAKRIHKAGGRLFFADEGGRETVFEGTGKAMLTIKAVMSELEREKILERTNGGRRAKAVLGQQPSRSVPPFGYIVVTRPHVIRGEYSERELGQYKLDDDTAENARQIFEKYAGGMTLRAIANELQARGIPTPNAKRRSTQGMWLPSTLRNILTNPVYMGYATFGRTKTDTDENRVLAGAKKATRQVRTTQDEWICLESPALVSVEVWEYCQRKLAENKATRGGDQKARYILTGLMRCPTCRRRMASRREHRGGIKYSCHYDRPSRNAKGEVCNAERHFGCLVEACVEDTLIRAAKEPDKFVHALRAYRQNYSVSLNAHDPQHLREDIAGMDRRIRAIVELQIEAKVKGLPTDEYDAILKELSEQRQGAKDRLAAIENQAKEQGASSRAEIEEASRIASVLADLEDALNYPEITDAEKNALLRSVVSAVWPDEQGNYGVELVSLSASASPCADVSQRLPSIQIISMLCPPGASR